MPSSLCEPSPSRPMYIPERRRICSMSSKWRMLSSVYWLPSWGLKSSSSMSVPLFSRVCAKIRFFPEAGRFARANSSACAGENFGLPVWKLLVMRITLSAGDGDCADVVADCTNVVAVGINVVVGRRMCAAAWNFSCGHTEKVGGAYRPFRADGQRKVAGRVRL